MKNQKWPLDVELRVNGEKVGITRFSSRHPTKKEEFECVVNMLPECPEAMNVLRKDVVRFVHKRKEFVDIVSLEIIQD